MPKRSRFEAQLGWKVGIFSWESHVCLEEAALTGNQPIQPVSYNSSPINGSMGSSAMIVKARRRHHHHQHQHHQSTTIATDGDLFIIME
jgi:hypothetical protein